MKRLFKLLSLALVLFSIISLSSCLSNRNQMFNAEGSLRISGEQTITVVTDKKITFNENINKGNILLSSSLRGKEVTNVKYIDSFTIDVTFNGTLERPSIYSEYAMMDFSIVGGMSIREALVYVKVYK